MKSFKTRTQSIRMIKLRRRRLMDMRQMWGRRETHRGFDGKATKRKVKHR
jgi:hypothetical protein